MMSREQPQSEGGIPPLEWLAAALGLLLVLGIVGFISWQAVLTPEQRPPVLLVKVERILSTRAGHIVQVVVFNRSPASAAAVQVEGELHGDSGDMIKSQISLNYVPGNSEKRGGLLFREDPQAHHLQVRILGYAEP